MRQCTMLSLSLLAVAHALREPLRPRVAQAGPSRSRTTRTVLGILNKDGTFGWTANALSYISTYSRSNGSVR